MIQFLHKESNKLRLIVKHYIKDDLHLLELSASNAEDILGQNMRSEDRLEEILHKQDNLGFNEQLLYLA